MFNAVMLVIRSAPMRSVLALAAMLAACQYEIDHHVYTDAGGGSSGRACMPSTTDSVCVMAASEQSFAWIQQNIFATNCFGSSCHDMGGEGKLSIAQNVTTAQAYTNLVGSNGVGVKSMIDPTRTLVVPGNGSQSWMEVMIQEIPPSAADPPSSGPPGNIGYMPQANGVLCCQKLDAIDRWITQGSAADN
jgi:hypothetical protein